MRRLRHHGRDGFGVFHGPRFHGGFVVRVDIERCQFFADTLCNGRTFLGCATHEAGRCGCTAGACDAPKDTRRDGRRGRGERAQRKRPGYAARIIGKRAAHVFDFLPSRVALRLREPLRCRVHRDGRSFRHLLLNKGGVLRYERSAVRSRAVKRALAFAGAGGCGGGTVLRDLLPEQSDFVRDLGACFVVREVGQFQLQRVRLLCKLRSLFVGVLHAADAVLLVHEASTFGHAKARNDRARLRNACLNVAARRGLVDRLRRVQHEARRGRRDRGVQRVGRVQREAGRGWRDRGVQREAGRGRRDRGVQGETHVLAFRKH